MQKHTFLHNDPKPPWPFSARNTQASLHLRHKENGWGLQDITLSQESCTRALPADDLRIASQRAQCCRLSMNR